VGGYPCRRAACLVLWLSVCRRELRSFPTRRSSDLEEPFRPASQVFATGVKPVYRLITKEGFELRLTGDHRVLTERGWVEAHALKPGDRIRVLNRGGGFGTEGSLELGRVLGWLVGDGTIKSDRAVLSFFSGEKHEVSTLMRDAVNSVVRKAVN